MGLAPLLGLGLLVSMETKLSMGPPFFIVHVPILLLD